MQTSAKRLNHEYGVHHRIYSKVLQVVNPLKCFDLHGNRNLSRFNNSFDTWQIEPQEYQEDEGIFTH